MSIERGTVTSSVNPFERGGLNLSGSQIEIGQAHRVLSSFDLLCSLLLRFHYGIAHHDLTQDLLYALLQLDVLVSIHSAHSHHSGPQSMHDIDDKAIGHQVRDHHHNRYDDDRQDDDYVVVAHHTSHIGQRG
jgi:hypothetical protein